VLAEIDRENLTMAKTRKTIWLGWLGSWGWVPRLAVVITLLAATALVFHWRQQGKAAHALAAVTRATPMPSTEELEDFESIFALPPPFPGADEELLALMK
jgi:hypothetical protein